MDDATQGLSETAHHRPNLILLDLAALEVAVGHWLNVLRQMPAGRELPVVLFGEARSDQQALEAFQQGSDDYVAKTCALPELAARIRAVLRRRFEREDELGEGFSLGPVSIDLRRHRCRAGRKNVDLRAREFELLEILMRNSGRVLSRSYLLETIWGMDQDAQTRTVDVTVGRLRRALGKRAARWIETIERYGYRFRGEEEIQR